MGGGGMPNMMMDMEQLKQQMGQMNIDPQMNPVAGHQMPGQPPRGRPGQPANVCALFFHSCFGLFSHSASGTVSLVLPSRKTDAFVAGLLAVGR